MEELFGELGEVKLILHFEKGSTKHSGYGFVEFKDADIAKVAIQKFDGYSMKGRAINVKSATVNTTSRVTLPTNSKASEFAQEKAKEIQRKRK